MFRLRQFSCFFFRFLCHCSSCMLSTSDDPFSSRHIFVHSSVTLSNIGSNNITFEKISLCLGRCKYRVIKQTCHRPQDVGSLKQNLFAVASFNWVTHTHTHTRPQGTTNSVKRPAHDLMKIRATFGE